MNCTAFELGGWAVGKAIFGGDLTHYDAASLTFGVTACAIFPAAPALQAAYLLAAESLYLHAHGATAPQLGITALMHTLGLASTTGLSRYAARVTGKFDLAGSRAARALRNFWQDELGEIGLPTRVVGRPRGTQHPLTAWAVKTGRAYDRRFRYFWRRFEGQSIGENWQVVAVNRRLGRKIQPDLVLVNAKTKTVRIHDITSRPNPAHLTKGEKYAKFFRTKYPGYEILYTEGYWSGLEDVVEATTASGTKYLPIVTRP
jgi:hypothetical protein